MAAPSHDSRVPPPPGRTAAIALIGCAAVLLTGASGHDAALFREAAGEAGLLFVHDNGGRGQ